MATLPDLNIGQLQYTVQQNCHISDAQYAGHYSLCVFLLKMREFYRWEHEIALTDPLPREDVGNWLTAREQSWENLETSVFQPLALEQQSIDPFENEIINQSLLPLGYVYSSGYGLFGKPHFFLGKLQEKASRDGLVVLTASCEYARDLVAPPAMVCNGIIYIRQESVRRYLWERLEEWRMQKQNTGSGPEAMTRALQLYGYKGDDSKDLNALLDTMVEAESRTMIEHEVGEARAGKMLGKNWEILLSTAPTTQVELVMRATRDLLADCLHTLPTLIDSRNEAAIHFYFANLTGVRRHLFPALKQAYQNWITNRSWSSFLNIMQDNQGVWLQRAQSLLALRHQPEQLNRHVDALLQN